MTNEVIRLKIGLRDGVVTYIVWKFGANRCIETFVAEIDDYRQKNRERSVIRRWIWYLFESSSGLTDLGVRQVKYCGGLFILTHLRYA